MLVGAHISLLENWPHVNFWYKKREKRYENDEIQWEEVRFTFYFKRLTKEIKKYIDASMYPVATVDVVFQTPLAMIFIFS